ncbi:adhesion G-protein coupled receptor G2 isoform X2 [Python bivittatus]|uniref:Adhesion G-protein coupled receptor G2 n=1 Tax=Python bivittatus TaxID=176946 RepID=A0A9F5N5N8_PYTBI|nr:adhesion G-protein coupled receptor G2 isoform X2 [Python bivittatus]
MAACKMSHMSMEKVWECLLKYKVSLCLLWLHLILAPGRAQDDFLNYRAVFSTPCNEIWTLSPGISIPALRNFTVCVFLKLYNSKNSWTAFVYSKDPVGNLSASDHQLYDLGLTGERDKLTVWIFGKEITWAGKLDNNIWYQICIRWKSEQQEVRIYINDEEKRSAKIMKTGPLAGNGQLLLGCSQIPGSSSSSLDGMVGELYMFRMWANKDINYTQVCQDGTIILWRKNNWLFNKTAQYSSSLPCASAADVSSNLRNFSVTTPEFSSVGTLDTAGTNILYNNVCKLSDYCKNSVFYMGSMKFRIRENSSDTSYNLTVKYPGNNTNQYQLKVYSTLLPEINISDFNKTLQKISQSSLMQCSEINQSLFNCIFIIKLDKQVNISNILSNLGEKAEMKRIESCCCLPTQTFSCPTAKELQHLQCDNNEPVACTGHSTPDSPVSSVGPFSVTMQHETSSSESTTVLLPPFTEPATINISNIYATQNPFTEQNTLLSSVSLTKSTNTLVPSTSLETNNSDFTTSSSQPTTTFPEIYPTKSTISHTTVLTQHTTSVSSAIMSTSSVICTTDLGGPSKISTEQISHNNSGITNSTDAPNVENIVSELEDNLTAGTITPSLGQSMLERVSFLLSMPQSQIYPMSKRIIKIVDLIGLKLNFSTKSINFTTPTLVLAVLKVNSSSFREVSFAVQHSSDLEATLGTEVPSKRIGAITLPSSIMADLSPQDKHIASRITFNFFKKTTLFQDPAMKNLSLFSYVISSSIANLSVSNLKTNVTVMLQNIRPNQENLTVRCAFWDSSENGSQGSWNSEGCVVKERTVNETICSCNHLTSFGVLLDLSRNTTIPPIQVLILTFITYIGCGLSAIFLSVTLVTYIAFEKIRRDYPSKILIQLCIALLLLNLVFLLDSWIALYEIQGLCISVAVFLHYFLLVSFTWMGLEAFHMYLALVKVFNTYVRKYILKFCIIGWGLPAIVVVIVLAVSPYNYGHGSYGKFPNGSSDEFCWIKNDIVFYITVVGYFCTIFLLNISMFIVVLIQLCRIKKKKQLGTQRKTSIQDLRSVAGLTFLLGITWGFAFFAWGPVNLVFMYLFAIFNTLQGFFIFIFYCVAKENVRKQWRRYLCCGKYRLAENSDWSRTATNGLRKQNVNQGVSNSSHSLQSNSNSTNSTSMLMSNDYSVHTNGNGNISREKNGVSFHVQNSDVQLPEFSVKQHENNDISHKKSCISLRRTSKRKSLQFIEPI